MPATETTPPTLPLALPTPDEVDSEGVHYFSTGYHNDFVSARPGEGLVDVNFCHPGRITPAVVRATAAAMLACAEVAERHTVVKSTS